MFAGRLPRNSRLSQAPAPPEAFGRQYVHSNVLALEEPKCVHCGVSFMYCTTVAVLAKFVLGYLMGMIQKQSFRDL